MSVGVVCLLTMPWAPCEPAGKVVGALLLVPFLAATGASLAHDVDKRAVHWFWARPLAIATTSAILGVASMQNVYFVGMLAGFVAMPLACAYLAISWAQVDADDSWKPALVVAGGFVVSVLMVDAVDGRPAMAVGALAVSAAAISYLRRLRAGSAQSPDLQVHAAE